MKILLRTLTEKSIIGFGPFKTTTVGNLLSIKDYRSLISIYYNLDRITFTEEILQKLYLNDPEFKISKPGKSPEHYQKFADMILVNLEVHNRATNAAPANTGVNRNMLDPRKRKMVIGMKKDMSRMLNRTKIQRGY